MCVCKPEKDKMEEMEEEKYVPSNSFQYCSARIMSSEIVEMVEDSVTSSIVEIEEDSSKCLASSRSGVVPNDVYVAVGKDDLDVLKWVLDHAVSPGARVFLVHVFPPITYIRTPVGRLSKSQLSQEQARYYFNEENNKRRNLLQKYIRLCTDAKVTVDTMLLESNVTSKAILDLIPVLNITNLVMGTKRPPRSRLLLKRVPKGEFVKKNAPDYCKVTVVYDGKNIMDEQQQDTKQPVDPSLSGDHRGRSEIPRRHTSSSSSSSERKFFECVCFSRKYD